MSRFDSFVILAHMRTGSNFLEANLNSLPGVTCHGEAFNNAFIGYPNTQELCGVTRAARDAAPFKLLAAIRRQPGLNGFRYFPDHDPRVRSAILDDPRCAKIVLSRDPLESFVSLKIAGATGQWKLTNAKHARSQRIIFDPAEFSAYHTGLAASLREIALHLQRTGQAAFHLDYTDLQDIAVLNGLAMYLDVPARLTKLDTSLKRQNPQPLADKVTNPAALEAAIAELGASVLYSPATAEPKRAPAVPTLLAAARSPLLFMPIKCGPTDRVRAWLAALDNVPDDRLLADFTQKSLRQWIETHQGFKLFTVVRHPLARAHSAFCTHIIGPAPGVFADVRDALVRSHGLVLPRPLSPGDDHRSVDISAHRAAFVSFLRFVEMNLGGQTALRTDPAWASQHAILQGLALLTVPHAVLSEDRLLADLAALASQIGLSEMPAPPLATEPSLIWLSRIYDAELEALARKAYPRDYQYFGFGDWRP